MIFTEMRIMRGPNMWSKNINHLIVIQLNPGAILPRDKYQQEAIIQYFREHYKIEPLHLDFKTCIYSFILQLAVLLQEGDSIYHDLRYAALEIPFGIVAYKTEEAGTASVLLAAKIVEDVLADGASSGWESALEQVKALSRRYGKGPTTSLIIDAARKRNIPISDGPAGYPILGYGKHLKLISAAISHHSTSISVAIACDKEDTKKFLESVQIPVPKGKVVRDETELIEIAEQLGYPLVTKPLNGNQGRNITCGITNFEILLTGFRYANERSKLVIVEKEIKGNDYRFLVVGHRFIAASLRVPASVIGDGISSVQALIDKENADVRRGFGHEKVLTKIILDDSAIEYLQKQNLEIDSIPEKGQMVYFKLTANLSTGGTAEDVTDLVHPSNKRLAEKASRVIGLDICGIDIISPDITQPLIENGGSVLEVNAAPGLRMHQYPSKGQPREVGNPIIDLMFKNEEDGRIPIVAVTGTNSKTTTTRLMAHIAAFVGHTVGFSSSDGIYIDGEMVESGDYLGPLNTKTILHDTTVDFAVLQCAREEIVRSGLGFDQCDIAIINNVTEDQLGLKDIYTVEDLALVKSVVPRSVKKDGWVLLNACNQHSYEMKDLVKCNVALFNTDENNENLIQHIASGGAAIYTDAQQDIYITHGGVSVFLMNAADAPITRKGKDCFMIEDLLPVALASYFLGFEIKQISTALKSFIPSADLLEKRFE